MFFPPYISFQKLLIAESHIFSRITYLHCKERQAMTSFLVQESEKGTRPVITTR